MKVAVYYNNQDIRIEERPVPHISKGEILVKMKASGICGTDVMQWYRTKRGPRVLGHEMAGEIVVVGEGVTHIKTGDRYLYLIMSPVLLVITVSGAITLHVNHSISAIMNQEAFRNS